MKTGFVTTSLMAGALALSVAGAAPAAPIKNGFDLGEALIPADQIMSGEPPRDGIPAISQPQFVKAGEADFLRDGDRVLAVEVDGRAKAYPIRILNWHEIVNDEVGGVPVAVTYCPLCLTGVVYRSTVDGANLQFGVSGLLYNNNVLMYDRQTESLWSQLESRAISGPKKGTALETIPAAHTTWADWRSGHPDTLVMSTETGYRRDYSRDPYANYGDSERVMFPVSNSDDRLARKDWVGGVVIDGKAKAYPHKELAKTDGEVEDSFAGRQLTIRYDPEARSLTVHGADGEEVTTIDSFWFSWAAFYPDTEVFRADD